MTDIQLQSGELWEIDGERHFFDQAMGSGFLLFRSCQSASKRDPLSACNRDPLLRFGMDVTSAPLARVGA